MRISRLILQLALASAPALLASQGNAATQTSSEADNRWRVTLTIFRSPGTGVQLSRGHLAVFAAHYPTVILRDGEQRNTQFLRVGAAYYVARRSSTSPYASLSFAPSLTPGWSNSALADVGVRRMFSRRYSGQLGVAVLHAPGSHATRVNPTVGLGVRF